MTTKTPNKLTLAFFKCDSLAKESIEQHGEYQDVVHNLFNPLLPPHFQLEIQTYDVLNKREYPTDEQLKGIDAVVISGSFEDDAHADSRWILRLAGFLIRLYDDYPRIRLLGICFGLQVIARAFGPSTIKENPKGWEVGSTRIELTDIGKRLIWGEGDDPASDTSGLQGHVTMQQIHADIVTDVPEDFHLLGHSELTPVQAIAHFYDDDKKPPAFTHSESDKLPGDPWSRIHVIAFQGHPEWHDDIIIPFIDDYEKEKTFTADFAEKARRQTRLPHDGDRIGLVLLKVLGIA